MPSSEVTDREQCGFRLHLNLPRPPKESFEPLFEQRRARPLGPVSRQRDQLAVQPLKRVLERWAVVLAQDIGTHFNSILGSDAKHVSIEGSMVDRAHGDTIRHNWFAAVRVLLNVSGI